MEPIQLEDENHISRSNENSITSVANLPNQSTEKLPDNYLPSTKHRWIWVGTAILLINMALLIISLINSQFGSLIGYQILIPTIASTLACLLGVAIIEIINAPTKRRK